MPPMKKKIRNKPKHGKTAREEEQSVLAKRRSGAKKKQGAQAVSTWLRMLPSFE
jgi:hypothetical protein